MSVVSFEDTQIAYDNKSNWKLRKAHGLFTLFNFNTLVDIGGRATQLALKLHLPIQPLVRHTIYDQFVGGENLRQVERTVNNLARYDVKSILDWGGEGMQTELEFDQTLQQHLKTLDYIQNNDNVKLVAVKVTGLGRFELLERVHRGDVLLRREEEEFKRIRERLHALCKRAEEVKTGIFFDAEETWIQGPLDALIEELMQYYNTERAIVYNTYQMYLHSRFDDLKAHFEKAEKEGYWLGAKLVRGAYMEKERERAKRMGYPSPIHKDKAAVDADYDAALQFALDRFGKMAFCAATHNEKSCQLLAEQVSKLQIPNDHKYVFFAQLYGMGDHITFNLSKAGFTSAKLIPYGPVKEVVPYLVRRAQENSSVSGQVGRELNMVTQEMKRRSLM